MKTNKGQFQKNTSGNPSGRPVGSRNRATLLAEQLLEGEAPQLIRKAFELANNGDVHALRLCLSRVYPIPKERCIDLELPVAKNVLDLEASFQCVLAAAGAGRITLGEANAWIELLNKQAEMFALMGSERLAIKEEKENRELEELDV
ncbi:MAG: DUF5681 domain-containing protein [Terriglobia bacterium]